MKTKSTFIKALLILVITGISIGASAQSGTPTPPPGVTPFSGPTVPTNVPSAATPVDKYICVGANVSLISNPTPPLPGVSNFLWWKQNSSGTWVLVANNTAPNNIYNNEATTAPGYYTYKVQTENTNGCESLLSNPINIFALPIITPAINGPSSVCQSVAAIPAPFTLSATPVADATYTYTYQWTRDGVNIPASQGGTSQTLSGIIENTPGTYTYGVNVSYSTALGNPTGVTCTATATKTITVTPLPATPTIQWN